MTITITAPMLAYAVLLIGLVAAVAYLYGDWRGSRTPQFALAPSAPTAVVQVDVDVDPFAHVPVDVPGDLEVAAQIEAIETIGYLDAITGPIPVVVAPRFGELVPEPAWQVDAAARLAAENLALTVERDALREEAARLRELAAWKEMLRARYLRLLRVERARVRAVFGDVWQRPRKPSLVRLAREVIEIGSAAHPSTARLVPLPIMRELAAAS
jgi:hypothetical protein